MANGAGEVTTTRAPRTLGRRLLLALVASLLATVALTVPLAYQAHSARTGDGTTDVPTPSTASTTPPQEPATTSTTDTVPVQVLPRTLERTDEALTWASAVDDPAPRPLDGATLKGQVVVQYQVIAEAPPIVQTEFWIDRPEDRRPPEHVDITPPFTLAVPPTATTTTTAAADPVTFDTTRLPDGSHAVVVQATDVNGNLVRSISRFEIDNG